VMPSEQISPGQTGTFFAPGFYELGKFVPCLVLDERGEKLIIELQDKSRGEILTSEFTKRYFVGTDVKEAGK
jgi:hypothetical protein